jgi:hypothetical protein
VAPIEVYYNLLVVERHAIYVSSAISTQNVVNTVARNAGDIKTDASNKKKLQWVSIDHPNPAVSAMQEW